MSFMVRLNLLNAQGTPDSVPSAVDFFRINQSSIKSEPQKSIFFDFWNFQSCLIDHAMIKKLIFFFESVVEFGIWNCSSI